MKPNQSGEHKSELIRWDWYHQASVLYQRKVISIANETTEVVVYQVIVIGMYFAGGRQDWNATIWNKQLTH